MAENKKGITVFAPATVANVGCGYDVLGLALDHYGDRMTLTPRADDRLVVREIAGAEGIPTDPDRNVATVAIRAMLSALGYDQGFDISITKNVAPGSGLGSSASSATAAVFGVNEWLGCPLDRHELIHYAMKGEQVASGAAHADNVAPSLLGGFTAVRSYAPLDVLSIPFPQDLLVCVFFPRVTIRTRDAKNMLQTHIPLRDAVTQWGNVAGLIAGLIQEDYELIGRSLQDVVAEPVRSTLIPMYGAVRSCCLERGALGFNISGSGPSMFALTNQPDMANQITSAVSALYQENGYEILTFVSRINPDGAVVL